MSFFIDGGQGDGGGARALGPVRLASLAGEACLPLRCLGHHNRKTSSMIKT